jgi:hypothetical protein
MCYKRGLTLGYNESRPRLTDIPSCGLVTSLGLRRIESVECLSCKRRCNVTKRVKGHKQQESVVEALGDAGIAS